ncbi:hypothetical protein QUF86_23505 [Peribacillus sp. NJ11]|uniref:hypothetical protein n=1 Tax=Peribacillus TaxID=2675229 RepID=UPI0025A245F6|nr:hypothetical protein [Peribacillus sp. NJ11]MDM5223638.1 hypothetical protein [Peribacillus sp. NJ11]
MNLTLSEGEVPDFLATGAIKNGEAVYVIIKNRETWKVEAGEDIQVGVSVETGKDGKIVEAIEGGLIQSSFFVTVYVTSTISLMELKGEVS